MQMLAGGVALYIVAALKGELGQVDLSAVTAQSALSVGYLIVFGSLIGYTAYAWLLRVCTPAAVATYAYVNPMVAMLLGWLIAGEAFGTRMIVAAAIILAGVALINRASARPGAPRQVTEPPSVRAPRPRSADPELRRARWSR
jgi:drug/metabolite transporter (DMT)-like permease